MLLNPQNKTIYPKIHKNISNVTYTTQNIKALHITQCSGETSENIHYNAKVLLFIYWRRDPIPKYYKNVTVVLFPARFRHEIKSIFYQY